MRIACPLCEGPSSLLFETRDHNRGLSDEKFRYRLCERCGGIFLADTPSEPDHSHERDRDSSAGERYKLDSITPFAPGGRLVELGDGTGTFARAARDAGYEVTEVEAANDPAQKLAELPSSHVIAMWDTLGHLEDPWACLEAAAGNLEQGGVLALAVPNPASFQLRVMRGRWPHVDAPRRRFLIPAGLLDERAGAAGLELVSLTANDKGSRRRNRLGWQRRLMGPKQSKARTGVARALGAFLAALMAPIERSGLRGTAYTAVFRKPE